MVISEGKATMEPRPAVTQMRAFDMNLEVLGCPQCRRVELRVPS
jgi:hypothetical protein